MTRQEAKRILCVSQSPSHLKELCCAIASVAYEAVPASSPEQAVACCSGNRLSAVVMDSEFFAERGWSVAQSLKMVNPGILIFLMEKGHNGDIPDGIDAVATTIARMLQQLKACFA
jgi:DNA-binding response OmpR family regulator